MFPVYGIYFHGSYRSGLIVVAARNKTLAKQAAAKHVERYYNGCGVGETAHRLAGCNSKTKGVKITDYYTE